MIFNRECRVPFVLAGRPRSASGRSQAWRGRGTGSPPVPPPQGPAITSASCFTGASQPPDPDLDRVWMTVPVTVSRASSAASGRCRPALTGVGAVPCDQSRAMTASRSRRITPPSTSAAGSPITARRVRRRQPISRRGRARPLPASRPGRSKGAQAISSWSSSPVIRVTNLGILDPYHSETPHTNKVHANHALHSTNPQFSAAGKPLGRSVSHQR